MDETRSIVAVVDDDTRVLESLQCLLEAAGHSVRTFASGLAFLQYVEGAPVDCLISDISMPVTDGFDLSRLVKKCRPDLPVILMTGRHELHGAAARCDAVRRPFLKPFDAAELLACVADVLRAGRVRADPDLQ